VTTNRVKELKTKKIGVLLGGRSSEREISLKSGHAVLRSLIRGGYRTVAIDARESLVETLTREGVEVAFIVLHGKWGEDGTVQGLLEIMAIPYTGSGVLGSSLAMDKVLMKLFFAGMGIPTPPYAVMTGRKKVDFPFPFVVKPANEGSTIGVSIVREERDKAQAIAAARAYERKLLLEKYVAGQEITVGIVNGKTLPVVEVRPASGFYDFKAKYTKGLTDYVIPAKVSKTVEERACDTAVKIYAAFELSGCVRIDMMVEDDMPLVIDINTSPGMTETSLVPKAWAHMGGTFDGLIEEILKEAALKS
jgi:D-alanine-D-alanine ligase